MSEWFGDLTVSLGGPGVEEWLDGVRWSISIDDPVIHSLVLDSVTRGAYGGTEAYLRLRVHRGRKVHRSVEALLLALRALSSSPRSELLAHASIQVTAHEPRYWDV